jgi:hypothetical protein
MPDVKMELAVVRRIIDELRPDAKWFLIVEQKIGRYVSNY